MDHFIWDIKYFQKLLLIWYLIIGLKSDKKIQYACKKLDSILKDSFFLKLNLIENVDFSYNDIDEVKSQSFSRKQLGYIYTYGYDLNNPKLELWNMHTLKNKIIEKEKLELIKYNDLESAKDIVLYMVDNTSLNIEKNCPFLFKYLKYIGYNK